MSSPTKAAGKELRLFDIDPRDADGMNRKRAKEESKANLKRIDELCYLMYAENKHSLLIVLQGIDASGKNGTMKHIAQGINPEGLTVHPFKAPSELELDHDYLWRVHQAAPRNGNVAIFNRSHYEEVIVTKVHPEIIAAQHLPESIANDPEIFEKRYRQINDFERMLVENGTTVLKFFLHISKEEQIERFRERLEKRKKQWKFSPDDLEKRKDWNRYIEAFEEMIHATSTSYAPWYVIPADRKWYRNWLIGKVVVKNLEKLKMKYPRIDDDGVTLEELARA